MALMTGASYGVQSEQSEGVLQAFWWRCHVRSC